MDMMFYGWVLVLFVLPLIFLIYTLFSLSSLGDEMAEYIKNKAAKWTLLVAVIQLSMEVVRMFVKGENNANPFTMLVVIVIMYCGSLVYYKRKMLK
ncbi:hypothetical protein G7081_07105 [Vagococcus coleopterorum]|uniref:Uncharacterized protein n=1 Tax=Vagococcus coleopterorum TaxID=2714946 RepID=A0A6G8AP46_9ENTE|nr:hypothetical protein [Vagococcus coleopterorum]QIL46854.1 hypothetical protein G7081_07105 [Vagococcus coleopterorum]